MAILEIKGDFKERVYVALEELNRFSSLLATVFEELEQLEEDIFKRSEDFEEKLIAGKLQRILQAISAVRKTVTRHLWAVGPYFKDNKKYKQKEFELAYRTVEDLIDDTESQVERCLQVLIITKDFDM